MYAFIKKSFDPVSGLISALIMATIVWWINASHGVGPASTSALKQAAFTFFMGGIIGQLCRYLAARPWPKLWAFSAGATVPALVLATATFGVHSLKGTPEPVLSTLPVIFISLPAFTVWTWILVFKQEKY
jgi:hypothetical protein